MVLAILCGLLWIPIPLFRSAPYVIEPHDVRHVYTKVPGQLVEVLVEPGQRVQQGQVLARLREPRSEDRMHELTTKIEVQKESISLAKEVVNPGSQANAEEGLATLQKQLQELEDEREHLTLVAPVDGTIVAPPRLPTPKLAQQKARLGAWSGTPLDPKNRSAFLDERTHFASIAPQETMQAVLYLDQADRQDVSLGMKVGLKFEHLPDRVFRGVISQLATAHSDFAPETLSVKHGGALPTVTDRDNKEKLENAAYQATVILDDSPELLRTNLRGNARFIVDKRSTFGWIWRYLRKTFYFRL